MPLKHTQIDAFRAVMSTGSITKAALLMNKSQPSVTRFIRDLEAEIGFPLFHRTGSRIVPNKDAYAFLKAVERSFAGLNQLDKAADDIRNMSPFRLSVATIPSATFKLLPEAVSRLQNPEKAVSVSTYVHRSPNVVERVRLQQATLGICNLAQPEHGIDIVAQYALPCVLVVPAGHPLADRKEATCADIAGYPFVSLGQEYFATQGVSPPNLRLLRDATAIETPLSHSACSYVRQGLGIAVVDPLTAYFYEGLGLCSVKLVPQVPYDLAIIRSGFDPTERGVSLFIEALCHMLHELESRLTI